LAQATFHWRGGVTLPTIMEMMEGGYGKTPSMPLAPKPGPYSEEVQLQEDGLPIRPGKAQCLVYTTTGTCNNGPMCIFDHPPQASLKLGGPPGGALQPMSSLGLGPSGGEDFEAGSSMPAASSDGGEALAPLASVDAFGGLGGLGGGLTGSAEAVCPPVHVDFNEDGLPMRPGSQKCSSYLRNGTCHYGPTCRYDHPAGLGGLLAGGGGFGNFPGMMGGPSTEGGLAIRPGKEQCPFLTKVGSCPFGPSCRFNHQLIGDISASMQAAQQPVSSKKAKGLGGVKSRRPVQAVWRA